jgi:DNA-directed RNA polymerase specialized sigma24 family protein
MASLVDPSVMRRRGADADALLLKWRTGNLDEGELFRLVIERMRHRAERGLRSMLGRANEDDVDEACFVAFKELLKKDPHQIKSLIGLASSIAFRRGQDVGRAIIRSAEFPDTDRVDLVPNEDLDPAEELIRAEEFAEHEARLDAMWECFPDLTPGQQSVIQATILGDQSLSDWATQEGKRYQAADQQQKRGLASLERCIALRLRGGGDDDN